MAAKLTEDCACGASFKYEGPIPSSVLSEWRRAHASHAQRALARKEKEAENALQSKINRIREILKDGDPTCNKYKDSVITCGWKRSVESIAKVIDDA